MEPEETCQLVRRPPRVWPRLPPAGALTLPAIPAAGAPSIGSRVMALLFPLVGLVSMVGFAVAGRSLVYLAVAGGVALATAGGSLAAQRAGARRARAHQEAQRRRYRDHLAAAEAEAAAAAAVQRAGLNGLFPAPEALSDCALP
ncbi:MAG: hypothetical protein ACYCTI_07620, partial [Acidimicrobiales bacterium]